MHGYSVNSSGTNSMTNMFQGSFENLVCEFVSGSCSSRRQVSHVLELGMEDEARLLPQLVLIHQLLQER